MKRFNVKVCGMTRPTDAALAAKLGADMIGLISDDDDEVVDSRRCDVFNNCRQDGIPSEGEKRFRRFPMHAAEAASHACGNDDCFHTGSNGNDGWVSGYVFMAAFPIQLFHFLYKPIGRFSVKLEEITVAVFVGLRTHF